MKMFECQTCGKKLEGQQSDSEAAMLDAKAAGCTNSCAFTEVQQAPEKAS